MNARSANEMTDAKKVLVMGASPTRWRYAHEAVKRLKNGGHNVIAFGKREGDIDGVPIVQEFPEDAGIHTISIYLNAGHQEDLMDFVLAATPKRVIFNPGAENPELQKRLAENGVEVLEACTLVMLSTGQF